MKNLKLFFGVAAMAAALTISCGPPPAIEVSDITLDKSTLDLILSKTYTLTATVLPDNATDKTVTWTSSNNDVATVSNGVISAKSSGTTTIIAAAGNKADTCEVTVDGALINGTVWATRNIGVEAGKFAEKPGEYGGYYSFNHVNNPDEKICPEGWRLPTKAEINDLFDGSKVSTQWTSSDGKAGRRFTDRTTENTIFLPAAGYNSSGSVYGNGLSGYYMSSDESGTHLVFNLYFDADGYNIGTAGKIDGLSVRLVAK